MNIKGYFSLIQYCPDVARQEAANIGVLLFCPAPHFIRAKVTPNVSRIRRFFGADAGGYLHLSAMKQAIVDRIQIEKTDFKTLQDVENFIQARASQVQLTSPKPLLVQDPERDLHALFAELVEEPKEPLTEQAKLPIRKRLQAIMTEAAVRPFIRTKVKVEAPSLKQTIPIPYAFQNGRMNLIRPITFKHQAETSVKTAACKYGMEGLTLFKHPDPVLGPLQVIVVGDFAEAPAGSEDLVKNVFEESNVRLFTPESLEALKQEILTHGKLV